MLLDQSSTRTVQHSLRQINCLKCLAKLNRNKVLFSVQYGTYVSDIISSREALVHVWTINSSRDVLIHVFGQVFIVLAKFWFMCRQSVLAKVWSVFRQSVLAAKFIVLDKYSREQ